MTWLKKKIKCLNLHRRGNGVVYTPVATVAQAITVLNFDQFLKHELIIIIARAKRSQL